MEGIGPIFTSEVPRFASSILKSRAVELGGCVARTSWSDVH